MKISIIMPVYNPEFNDLNKAILSCLNQTYSNWELCICDDGSTKPYVKQLIKEFMKKDERIKAVFSNKNEHICIASKKALSLAKGDYIGFLDHDDILDKKALEEVIKEIKTKNPDMIYTDEAVLNKNNFKDPLFKPDFSPEILMSNNYICHFVIIRRKILDRINSFESGTEGAQDYDLMLKISEKTNKICHIPKILYYWRKSKNSVLTNPNNKLYSFKSGKKVLENALKRRKINGKVIFLPEHKIYKINYQIIKNAKVSIIIPFKDKINLTKNCVKSILENTNYNNYEIILVNNQSSKKETFSCLKKIKNPKIKIINYNKTFNFSKINNYASKFADGDYLLFLNNDTKILGKNWLEEMLSVCQQKQVGIVGCKMIFPNNRIQHAGVSFNKKIGFYQAYYNFDKDFKGYNAHNLIYRRNCLAVLGACLMIKKNLFDNLGGFDENLAVEKNDVDLCLRVIKKGYQIIFTPFTKIVHYQSVSRKGINLSKDNKYFLEKWKEIKDPFTNENIILDKNYISKDSKYHNYYQKRFKSKIYLLPFYLLKIPLLCFQEHGLDYTLKKFKEYFVNPKLLTHLIKSRH